ncbi:MAG TPA: hypothetical protein VGV37_06360 [Aliidongia sp.]|uniref:hypothetical protein n=1 Tax=Aliidongia sp. TaxID=1914230 RepID=UPI002DDD7305|nr:hypothetical protein [Aliidongia sp.]HEV2674148.1 hypothetical protein [Aliidongia sp.]
MKMKWAFGLLGLLGLAGVAAAQTMPGLFIASPTGNEQINVINGGPAIATVTLRQIRDASGYQIVTQATSQTVQVANTSSVLDLTGATVATTATVNLPLAPIDGQRIQVFSQAGVTTLTLAAPGGQTIVGGATALAANGSVEYIYQLSTTTYFRIQ